MSARHSAHGNPQLISETSGMMPNLTVVGKFSVLGPDDEEPFYLVPLTPT